MTSSPGAVTAFRVAAWFTLIFGADLALCVVFGWTAPLDLMMDLAFWPLDGAQSAAAAETRLFVGICGGLMAGWGWTMVQMSRRLSARQAASDAGWIRAAAAQGLLLWFALDSAASVAAGAPANVIGNAAFLALLALPLWLMRPRAATALS